MNSKAVSFEFTKYEIQNKTDFIFSYTIYFHDQTTLEFNETIKLPKESSIDQSTLRPVLKTLHLMLGLSYWKLYCPKEIKILNYSLSQEQATFWNTVYTKGLGEFFYRNQIDFRDLIHFPYQSDSTNQVTKFNVDVKALMGIGGGKDSLVNFELLKQIQVSTTGIVLETQKEYSLIKQVIEKMQIDTLHIERHIDPKLFDQNSLPETYNGHIPITGIYSVISVLAAAMYGYKYIVMSNEKSANYGNVSYLGMEINHQWSKSKEFETMFQNYITTYITKDISYFSLLRPASELKIVQEFVKYPEYFQVFSSCNNNFKILKNSMGDSRWCGKCPKCAFVFSLLAAYLPKEIVLSIFKKNLYEDESLLPLYEELLGIKDFKPFECVGTPDEVKAAFYLAYKKNEYKDSVVMKMFQEKVLPSIVDGDKLVQEILAFEESELIPDEIKDKLKGSI